MAPTSVVSMKVGITRDTHLRMVAMGILQYTLPNPMSSSENKLLDAV